MASKKKADDGMPEKTASNDSGGSLSPLEALLAPRQLSGEDALLCLTRILREYDDMKAHTGRGFFA